MIEALNGATPAVFGLMDYWCFDGWFAIKKRLAQKGAPVLKKTLFPGVELRLAAPMQGRLNAHVLFSDEISDQHLLDFLSRLRLELTDQPLSRGALIDYARRVGKDKLKVHGFDKADVDHDDQKALEAGYVVAELKVDSYKDAIRAAPANMAVGYMPFTTNDGLGSIKFLEHYAYAIGLFEASPIFEARDDATWNAFVGRKVEGNEKWIENFQAALRNVPRLPISGSDAHQFVGVVGDNDRRGYGDFPSDRITWIKADPTWLGLLQTIKEPARRCYIGSQPPKLQQVAKNGSFYVKSVSISKVSNSALADIWFDGIDVPLNPDLVAIIGNKGSGKSALADVLALLGNSQERKFFSFLKPDRFRGKSGEPARQFNGTLNWLAGESYQMNLADDPSSERVELIRYIPQGRFEALCNDHVAGRSGAFERELRAVIFSHISDEARLGALDFDQLTEEQEKGFRGRLSEARKNLNAVNRSIAAIEDQMHPSVRQNIEEQIRLKQVQLKSLQEAKPAQITEPSEQLTTEQQEAATKLNEISKSDAELVVEEKASREHQTQIAAIKNAAKEAIERIDLFETQLGAFRAELTVPLSKLGIKIDDVVSIAINRECVNKAIDDAQAEGVIVAEKLAAMAAMREQHAATKKVAAAALNEPQRLYQSYVSSLKEWEKNVEVLIGSESVPDSMKGLERRREQIDALPAQLEAKRKDRATLTASIFDVLSEQRDARSALFVPLQKLIADNQLIREEYKLQFKAELSCFHDSISDNLFSLIKQNAGNIRGEDESRQQIKSRCDTHDLDKKDGALAFVDDVHSLLQDAARQSTREGFDLGPLMRKGKVPTDVYDYIFGLGYLEPKYTLLFQDTQIEQLSPGQRGALLLIFYLLVDKGRNPIILDQPEENLDNETVVSLLVPVLSAAKEQRQIIMVTHNPNLAVVCDAEQIIFAEFDRKAGSVIRYSTGSIENSRLNGHVVNVLEGTKPAFDNRSKKYH
ncbi:ABC transporter [Methylocystis sp. WRRC1]|nr:ABC transporter [Methylocystis sp. WRRC1]MCC3246433.1 ABC transporter [Methylocystis sp. WRRC1]